MPAKLNQLIAALPETVSCQWSALLEDVEMRLGNVRHQSGRSVGQVSNMLGVRRERVSEAAFALQKAGLIKYARGHITVMDRQALERRSCECYAVVKAEYRRLLPVVPAPTSWAPHRAPFLPVRR